MGSSLVSEKKTALVTGASRGIGNATAAALAAAGYDLILTGYSHPDKLETIAHDLEKRYSRKVTTHVGDVSDPVFIKEMFSSMDHLDLLVNNAGISYVGLLQDMSDEDWNRTMGVNLNSIFYTCREAIPVFLRNDTDPAGRIINISSVWGIVGAATEAAYSASKGAVNAFTKALAKELAPSRIPVNAIACGFIDTEMNGHLSEEEKQAVIAEIPADRIGLPSEVADAVVLAASAPAYMTGQIITVDGGWI
ncbi:MAG: SDR family oxidoreductase [Lachnospiraceae bacterium]|nr:SDR family oxidoreductase [Lachnospiraceae bacterium]